MVLQVAIMLVWVQVLMLRVKLLRRL